MDGPFNPNIMPIHSSVKYLNRIDKWTVFVSRQVKNGDGVRYENTRARFNSYLEALTFISVYWGNS